MEKNYNVALIEEFFRKFPPKEEASSSRTEPREGWNDRKAADKKQGRYGAGWKR